MTKTVEQKHLIGGQEYTLTYNFHTLVKAEEATGQSVMELGNNLSMRTIGGLFWAALHDKHPMSQASANSLVDEAGIERVSEWVGTGIGDYMGRVGVGDEKAAA